MLALRKLVVGSMHQPAPREHKATVFLKLLEPDRRIVNAAHCNVNGRCYLKGCHRAPRQSSGNRNLKQGISKSQSRPQSEQQSRCGSHHYDTKKAVERHRQVVENCACGEGPYPDRAIGPVLAPKARKRALPWTVLTVVSIECLQGT